jgi:hypothetical protein
VRVGLGPALAVLLEAEPADREVVSPSTAWPYRDPCGLSFCEGKWVGAVEVDQLIGAATGSEPARAQSPGPPCTACCATRSGRSGRAARGAARGAAQLVGTVPRRRLRAAPQRHYERHRNAAIFAASQPQPPCRPPRVSQRDRLHPRSHRRPQWTQHHPLIGEWTTPSPVPPPAQRPHNSGANP